MSDQGRDVVEAAPQPSLLEEVETLRERAREDVRDRVKKLRQAEELVTSAKDALHMSVVTADRVGIEADEIAAVSGFSRGTVQAWIREAKGTPS